MQVPFTKLLLMWGEPVMLDTADIFLGSRESLQSLMTNTEHSMALWRSREARKPGQWNEGRSFAQSQGSPLTLNTDPYLSWYGFEESTLVSKDHMQSPREQCNFLILTLFFFGLQSSLFMLVLISVLSYEWTHETWCLSNDNLLLPHAMWWQVLKANGIFGENIGLFDGYR